MRAPGTLVLPSSRAVGGGGAPRLPGSAMLCVLSAGSLLSGSA